MSRKRPFEDPDASSEEQAHMLYEAVFANDAKDLPFTGLPAVFHPHGKALPREEDETKVKYNLGQQLHDQRQVDRRNTHRTFNQMGGQFGFRGNDKKK